jgi:class 3 adenylate cyclase
MTFNDVLSQTIAMLRQHGRVSYRALKRQFDLDDAYLEDLTDALLFAHPQVRDEEGRGLVWQGDPLSVSLPAVRPDAAPPDATPPAGTLPTTQVPDPRVYTPPHLVEKILTSHAALQGERKQVTVLFCDLTNSTALAARVGPETMHALLNQFFAWALTEVHRYEGTINQFLGDGFMALFGAPIAHEDHARRAVLAALGLQRRLHAEHSDLQAQHGVGLAVRMGVNTGLVVVGAIGDNLRMDYTAVGDTTNLAARLQQTADPGRIVLSEATHRLVAGYCVTPPSGPSPSKAGTSRSTPGRYSPPGKLAPAWRWRRSGA